MEILISLISILVGLGSFVCFVIVLIKLFSAEGIWKGLLGLICGLYALYWGYTNREQQKLQTVISVWAILIALNIILGIYLQGGS